MEATSWRFKLDCYDIEDGSVYQINEAVFAVILQKMCDLIVKSLSIECRFTNGEVIECLIYSSSFEEYDRIFTIRRNIDNTPIQYELYYNNSTTFAQPLFEYITLIDKSWVLEKVSLYDEHWIRFHLPTSYIQFIPYKQTKSINKYDWINEGF